MKIEQAWMQTTLSIVAMLICGSVAQAQSFPQMGPTSAPSPYGAHGYPAPGQGAPAQFGMAGPMSSYAPQYGAAAPASYGGPAPQITPVGYAEYGGLQGGGAGCSSCGGYGCQSCGGEASGFDTVSGLFSRLAPYAAGGNCSPRWFDVQFDFMLLSREDVSRRVNFTSNGASGPIVLSTDSIDFDEEPGFRLNFAIQVGPSDSVEFGYFGLFNYAEAASVASGTDNLFSVFSNFGVTPVNGFAETDRASLHRIEYSTSFDNLELNFRRRWTGPNCRFQGSWLAGVRYFKLDEQFLHTTISTLNSGRADIQVNTANSMTGVQLGGDLWMNVIPGIRIGGEIEAGLFGNRADQRTNFTATSLGTPLNEFVRDDQAAFVIEAALSSTYQISQSVILKTGYQFLYVDGVALAPENFNTQPPFLGPRTVSLNANGDVFYHGFTGSIEWLW